MLNVLQIPIRVITQIIVIVHMDHILILFNFIPKKMNESYIYQSSYYNDSSKLHPGKNNDWYKAQEVEVYKIIIN